LYTTALYLLIENSIITDYGIHVTVSSVLVEVLVNIVIIYS